MFLYFCIAGRFLNGQKVNDPAMNFEPTYLGTRANQSGLGKLVKAGWAGMAAVVSNLYSIDLDCYLGTEWTLSPLETSGHGNWRDQIQAMGDLQHWCRSRS